MIAHPINFYEEEAAAYTFFAITTTTVWGSAWCDCSLSCLKITPANQSIHQTIMLVEEKTLQIFSFTWEAKGILHSKDREIQQPYLAVMPRKSLFVSFARRDMDFQEELETNAVTFWILVPILFYKWSALDFARKPEWDIPAWTKKIHLQQDELPSKMAWTQNGRREKLQGKVYYIRRR